MTLPFIGSVTARVVDASDVSIHGDVYTDATLEPEAALGAPTLGGATVRVRIAAFTCEGGRRPREGDRVRVELLMGQVTRVEVLSGA